MREGDRVKLRPEASLGRTHPELATKIGVVGSMMRTGGATFMHVRYAEPINLLVLNVSASQFVTVDHLDPVTSLP